MMDDDAIWTIPSPRNVEQKSPRVDINESNRILRRAAIDRLEKEMIQCRDILRKDPARGTHDGQMADIRARQIPDQIRHLKKLLNKH